LLSILLYTAEKNTGETIIRVGIGIWSTEFRGRSNMIIVTVFDPIKYYPRASYN